MIEECTVRNQIWKSKWKYVTNRLVSGDFVINQNSEIDVDLWMIAGLLKLHITDYTISKAEIETRIDVVKLKNIDFFKPEIARKPIVQDDAF